MSVDTVAPDVHEFLQGLVKEQKQAEKNRLALQPVTDEERDDMLKYVFDGGKHEGKTLETIAATDSSYLLYLCDKNEQFTQRQQSIIKQCIKSVRQAEDDAAGKETENNPITKEEITELLGMVVTFGKQFKNQTVATVLQKKPQYLLYLKRDHFFTARQRRIVDLLMNPKKQTKLL